MRREKKNEFHETNGFSSKSNKTCLQRLNLIQSNLILPIQDDSLQYFLHSFQALLGWDWEWNFLVINISLVSFEQNPACSIVYRPN